MPHIAASDADQPLCSVGLIRFIYGTLGTYSLSLHSESSEGAAAGSVELSLLAYELPHDKTNKMTCMSSEDSDLPGHLLSLIRVFAVRMKKHWVLGYP